jgi:hypothetical protein
MTPKISQFFNRTVMVSIPALFDDGACRPFTLLGAELHGLWLQSDELTRRLLPGDQEHLAATATAAVFVPFAQIAGVLVATGPAPSQEKQQPETATSDAAARGSRRTRSSPKAGGAIAPKP